MPNTNFLSELENVFDEQFELSERVLKNWKGVKKFQPDEKNYATTTELSFLKWVTGTQDYASLKFSRFYVPPIDGLSVKPITTVQFSEILKRATTPQVRMEWQFELNPNISDAVLGCREEVYLSSSKLKNSTALYYKKNGVLKKIEVKDREKSHSIILKPEKDEEKLPDNVLLSLSVPFSLIHGHLSDTSYLSVPKELSARQIQNMISVRIQNVFEISQRQHGRHYEAFFTFCNH